MPQKTDAQSHCTTALKEACCLQVICWFSCRGNHAEHLHLLLTMSGSARSPALMESILPWTPHLQTLFSMGDRGIAMGLAPLAALHHVPQLQSLVCDIKRDRFWGHQDLKPLSRLTSLTTLLLKSDSVANAMLSFTGLACLTELRTLALNFEWGHPLVHEDELVGSLCSMPF